MGQLWIRFRDWMRGYTDAEMLSMKWKLRDPDIRWPDDLTPGEARAWIQYCSAD